MKSVQFFCYTLCCILLSLNSCDLARIPSLTPPTAAFSVDKTTCEAPCTITITNNSSNAVSYRWDFGNGQSSDAQNPNKITYTTPGMYSVQLITIGEEGLKDTVVVVISIAEKGKPPVAKFSVSNNNCTAPCDPGCVNESLNGSSYRWEFGSPDSTSTEMSPKHTFKKGGDYAVKLSVSNAFGSDDTTVMVKILEPVKADFSFTASNDGFIPTTVAFTNKSSDNATSFKWDFGDPNSGSNNTSTQKNSSHSFNAPGTYIVKLTATTVNGVSNVKVDTLKLKYRTFGVQLGTGSVESVVQTLDGGYLLGTSSGWIKCDQMAKEEWRYFPATSGTDKSQAVQTENGDFYFAYTFNTGSGSVKKIRVVRANNSGRILRQQDINSTETEGSDYLGDLIINRSKELILYGSFYRKNATAAVLKLEEKTYKLDPALTSSPTSTTINGNFSSIANVTLLHASDNNYVGVRAYFAVFTIAYQVFSINSTRNGLNWDEIPNDVNSLSDLIQHSNGGIYVVGRRKSTNRPHISKHSLGTGFVDNTTEFAEYPTSSFTGIVNSSDQQLVVCGSGNAFLAKINANGFSKIWDKPISNFIKNPSLTEGSATDLANTTDGGYVVVANAKIGPTNYIYLIKTDPNGNL